MNIASLGQHDEQRRLAALHRMCVLDTPPDPAMDRITALTGRLLNAPIVMVSLIDGNRQWFKSRVGLDASETPRDQSFCAHAIREMGVMVINDATQDPRFKENPLVLGAPHIRFYAGAPLRTQSGFAIGTLCVADTRPRTVFSAGDLALLSEMADLAMVRLEALRSTGQVNQITGLPNHYKFLEDIEKLIDGKAGAFASSLLAAIDIVSPQDYHAIVKVVGHRYAEELMINARNRLRTALFVDTTIYHIGPGRFAAVFPGGAVPEPADLLDTVTRAFRMPIDCGGVPIAANTCIGLIGLNGSGGPGHLLRALMTTVDDVRDRGLKWGYYDPAMDDLQQRAFAILSALHRSIEAGDGLTLFYQPRIDLSTGRCVGVEALLRWHHATLGSISPAEFIPLAEKTALIGPLTEWVLSSALRQTALWRGLGHTFKVAINVSAADIERGDFSAKVSDQLVLHGVSPDAIELEFTENALIQNPAVVQAQLSQLRDLGIDISIDDFGTGYCNIAYLKTIPASVVKIDQSFVRTLSSNEQDQTIVRAMIEMAHNLGHRVVAEGVETQASFDLLRQWSCDEVQGYFIARPMDERALMQWIDDRLA